jgi:hypothetical protein
MGVHPELTSESQLDDCLFLSTPEESEEAAKDRNREKDQRPHGDAILHDQRDQNESEATYSSHVSSVDGSERRGGKPSEIKLDEY